MFTMRSECMATDASETLPMELLDLKASFELSQLFQGILAFYICRHV